MIYTLDEYSLLPSSSSRYIWQIALFLSMNCDSIMNQPIEAVDTLIPINSLLKLRLFHKFIDIRVEKLVNTATGQAGYYNK
jgi:hypothetical protein